jgi:hypothetical protein
MPELSVLVSQLVDLCLTGPRQASKDTSLLTLSFLQSWFGPFVALQIALDLEFLLPQLFCGDHALDVGPGAVSVLQSLFQDVGGHTGMVRRRSAQVSARPLCFEVARLIEHSNHPAAVRLRLLCDEFKLPLPGPKVVQYWSCEVRQLEDRLQAGTVRERSAIIESNDLDYCTMFQEPWARQLLFLL